MKGECVKSVKLKDAVGTVVIEFGNILQRPLCLRFCAKGGTPGEGETLR